jgi:hypothetical protein
VFPRIGIYVRGPRVVTTRCESNKHFSNQFKVWVRLLHGNGSSKELVTTYAKNYGLEIRVFMLGGTICFDSKEKKRIAGHS